MGSRYNSIRCSYDTITTLGFTIQCNAGFYETILVFYNTAWVYNIILVLVLFANTFSNCILNLTFSICISLLSCFILYCFILFCYVCLSCFILFCFFCFLWPFVCPLGNFSVYASLQKKKKTQNLNH